MSEPMTRLDSISVTMEGHIATEIVLHLDAGGGDIVAVPIQPDSDQIPYLGWTLVVLGGFAFAARGGEFSESAGQDAMASALTSVHQHWHEADPRAFAHLAQGCGSAVPTMLRSMAKTCIEMADELERDGVTVFSGGEG